MTPHTWVQYRHSNEVGPVSVEIEAWIAVYALPRLWPPGARHWITLPSGQLTEAGGAAVTAAACGGAGTVSRLPENPGQAG